MNIIGAAGVSAVPLAARVCQVEGAKADPSNFANKTPEPVAIQKAIAPKPKILSDSGVKNLSAWVDAPTVKPKIITTVSITTVLAVLDGAKADPSNFLIMHAMAPNVAGVIGSAVAAGVFISKYAAG